MIRMTEILKNIKNADASAGRTIKKNGNTCGKNKTKPQVHKRHHFKVKCQELKSDNAKSNNSNIESTIDKLCDFASKIYAKDADIRQCILDDSLSGLLREVFKELKDNPFRLLEFAYNYDTVEKNYLRSHSVSSAIYSIRLAQTLGYIENSCIEIGTAAFLHDIGMKDYLNLVETNETLTESEYEMQKFHVTRAEEILQSFDNIPEAVVKAVKQHHERYDGSGYPEKLKRSKITEYSQIISIIDVYTALIHKRSYRNKFNSIDAIELMLENKESYSYRLIKKLIESIGLFPVGSIIELNTGERGVIIELNQLIPLRPKIKITNDAHGDEIIGDKLFDLTKHQTLYIEKVL